MPININPGNVSSSSSLDNLGDNFTVTLDGDQSFTSSDQNLNYNTAVPLSTTILDKVGSANTYVSEDSIYFTGGGVWMVTCYPAYVSDNLLDSGSITEDSDTSGFCIFNFTDSEGTSLPGNPFGLRTDGTYEQSSTGSTIIDARSEDKTVNLRLSALEGAVVLRAAGSLTDKTHMTMITCVRIG